MDSNSPKMNDAIKMCVTNCGFYASGVSGYCSKCARAQDQISQPPQLRVPPNASVEGIQGIQVTECNEGTPPVIQKASSPLRCDVVACRKKLGLTGFKCKCGKLLCGTHHLPECHSCEFDHKTHGREKIASENPLIAASKISRI